MSDNKAPPTPPHTPVKPKSNTKPRRCHQLFNDTTRLRSAVFVGEQPPPGYACEKGCSHPYSTCSDTTTRKCPKAVLGPFEDIADNGPIEYATLYLTKAKQAEKEKAYAEGAKDDIVLDFACWEVRFNFTLLRLPADLPPWFTFSMDLSCTSLAHDPC